MTDLPTFVQQFRGALLEEIQQQVNDEPEVRVAPVTWRALLGSIPPADPDPGGTPLGRPTVLGLPIAVDARLGPRQFELRNTDGRVLTRRTV